MRTLVLSLFNKKNRPSFECKSNGFVFMALFDSGAEAPSWRGAFLRKDHGWNGRLDRDDKCIIRCTSGRIS